MDHKPGKEISMYQVARNIDWEWEFDEDLAHIATGMNWESVFPEIRDLMSSPSYYTLQVMHSMEKYLREQLVDFDLTRTQLSLLASMVILTKGGKIVTQMDLANFLNADKMVVSAALRTLERKGYILRQKHPADGRAKSLVVTEKGLRVIKHASKQAVKCDEQFFSALGEDKKEYIRMLKKLL